MKELLPRVIMNRLLRWIAAPVVTAAAAFLFLAHAQSDNPSGANQQSNRAGVQNHCAFHSLQLPKEFVVYATGAYSGRETPYVITDSARPATEMQVYVNGLNTCSADVC